VFTLQVPTSSPWHGKTLELAELRWYNGHPVGFFKDVSDRTAAEGLAKAILWIDLDESDAASTEEDAWYDHQLVGLRVERDGEQIGTVKLVEHMPAQDLLIVKTTDGTEVMVPFVKAIVPSVDVAAGVVTVTPPAGLFEELPDDDTPRRETAGSAQTTADEPATAPADEPETAPAESSVDPDAPPATTAE
jgi:16S rRNA processing protein RimM